MRVRTPIAPEAPFTSVAKWAFLLLPELLRIARFIRANDIAIVNVHFPSVSALQFVLARMLFGLRVRIVLSFHGQDLVLASTAVGMERGIWGFLLRKADALVSCSDALGDCSTAFEPAIRQRFTTIHNGLDIDYLMRASNSAAQIDPRLVGRTFILTVAAYEPKKGLDTLLHAFRTLRDNPARDTLLCLVGPEGGMGNELRQLAKQMGLAEHVVFCDEIPHSDLHVYYKAASVFCLPSRAEPFGIVLLEAGAFRCPVIATSAGGVPEILTDGVNARLVPPGDPAALAAQLDTLLRDRTECDRLSAALFDHVQTHFTWRRAYSSYAKLCLR
jgi:glycogen(starch) synthase